MSNKSDNKKESGSLWKSQKGIFRARPATAAGDEREAQQEQEGAAAGPAAGAGVGAQQE